MVQYIPQTLPQITDAPLSKNNPGRRSEIFETISKHLQLSIDIILNYSFLTLKIYQIGAETDGTYLLREGDKQLGKGAKVTLTCPYQLPLNSSR